MSTATREITTYPDGSYTLPGGAVRFMPVKFYVWRIHRTTAFYGLKCDECGHTHETPAITDWCHSHAVHAHQGAADRVVIDRVTVADAEDAHNHYWENRDSATGERVPAYGDPENGPSPNEVPDHLRAGIVCDNGEVEPYPEPEPYAEINPGDPGNLACRHCTRRRKFCPRYTDGAESCHPEAVSPEAVEFTLRPLSDEGRGLLRHELVCQPCARRVWSGPVYNPHYPTKVANEHIAAAHVPTANITRRTKL